MSTLFAPLPFQPQDNGSGVSTVNGSLSTGLVKQSGTAEPGIMLLKCPKLIVHHDFAAIQNLDPTSQAKWRSFYYKAFEEQEKQRNFWDGLCKTLSSVQDKKFPKDKAIETISRAYDHYLSTEKPLKTLNKEIEKYNKKKKNKNDFGKVQCLPCRYVGLESSQLLLGETQPGEDDDDDDRYQDAIKNREETDRAQTAGENEWEAISSNPVLADELAPIYSQGYLYQLYFNALLDDAFSDDNLRIAVNSKLSDLNQAIEEKVKKAPDFKGNARLMLAATLPIPLEGASQFDPDDEDDAGDATPVEEQGIVPPRIQWARSRIGGQSGLLSEVLNDVDDRFQIQDLDLKRRWNEFNNNIRGLAKLEGISPVTRFDINIGQLKSFQTAQNEIERLQKVLLDNPTDVEARKEYNSKRNAARAIVAAAKFPVSYLDAILPRLPPTTIQQSSSPPPAEISQQLGTVIRQASESHSTIEVLKGLVQSEMQKLPDIDGEAEVTLIQETLEVTGGEHYLHNTLESYQLSRDKARKLITQCSEIERARKSDPAKYQLVAQQFCTEHPVLTELFSKVIELPGLPTQPPNVNATPPLTPEANAPSPQNLTPPASPSRTKAPAPPPKPTVLRAVKVPSTEYTTAQLMTPVSQPGVVSDMVDGKEVYKAVQHYRAFKKTIIIGGQEHTFDSGYHIMLRWVRAGYKQPTFEWVQGSKFKGVVQDFKDLPGDNKEWAPGTPADLRKTLWKHIRIGGVSFYPRNESRTYDTTCPCYILLFNTEEGSWKWKWFVISTIRSMFGNQRVDTARDAYCKASGQAVPPKAESKKELRRRLEMSNRLLEQRISAMRTARGGVSVRTRSRRHIIEDSEDEGEDLEATEQQDEQESGSEDEDGASDVEMRDFISDDEDVQEAEDDEISSRDLLKAMKDKCKELEKEIEKDESGGKKKKKTARSNPRS